MHVIRQRSEIRADRTSLFAGSALWAARLHEGRARDFPSTDPGYNTGFLGPRDFVAWHPQQLPPEDLINRSHDSCGDTGLGWDAQLLHLHPDRAPFDNMSAFGFCPTSASLVVSGVGLGPQIYRRAWNHPSRQVFDIGRT